MQMIKTDVDFSMPDKLLDILLSDNLPYHEILETAYSLLPKIKTPHTNLEGYDFHAISQCILECYKIKCKFNSTKWSSAKQLQNGLKDNAAPLVFSRKNSKEEMCVYQMFNEEQIDFSVKFAPQQMENIEKTAKSEIKGKAEAKNQEDNDDSELKNIVKLIKSGENVFITGHAGTGKSYILNKLKEKFRKLVVTSTTGIAAVNVKGQTIHSFANIGVCKNTVAKTVEKIMAKKAVREQLQNCKLLAIDEISMLNYDTFLYLNEVLKLVRENTMPFGGIQVVFIGDFFQLPPVEKEDENSKFCFEAELWDELNFKNVILTKNYRQSDEKFIKALSDMRNDKLDDEDISLLNTRECDKNFENSDILHIFSTNKEADEFNAHKFNALRREVCVFEAKDCVMRGANSVYDDFSAREAQILEIFDKNCKAQRLLELKIGCRVMLLINYDFKRGLINGSCGTVLGFLENSVKIKFDNNVQCCIPMQTFEYYFRDKLVAKRVQYPLKLAYAITIHKSQGMTLDKLVVDCRRIFERGQAYVAMSRVKTLEGLYLLNFHPSLVMNDRRVLEFYKNLNPVDYSTIKEVETLDDEALDDCPTSIDIKNAILDCVKEFNAQYGISGIVKILSKSSSIKENDYNSQIFSSEFYGALSHLSQKQIKEAAQALVDSGELKIKRVEFGRPLLCV